MIVELEKQLKDAEADREARRKDKEEEKLPSASVPRDILTELDALRAENTNLKREQRLMASAFHDQASRLQVTTVTLQRQSEQPASWLGKQRRIVEGNLARMGVGRR
ncbi:MAG: hypothetical protein L6R39_001466 [Caloplaca ligustica]|nr:MAG: hypothetical protein L6R39_001466 [Caloplaca ligustica]